jgi:hypothetical protein
MLNFGHTQAFAGALDNPFEGLGQGFTEDQPTGFADGRQAYVSPVLRTVVLQLSLSLHARRWPREIVHARARQRKFAKLQ